MIQAEHPSLEVFLRDNLSEHQQSRVGLMSFNQWPWTTAALTETAVAFHRISSSVVVAFWSDRTPLHDPGWSTSHRIARLFGSRSIESAAQELIEEGGVPRSAFVDPPIPRHKVQDLPDLPNPLTRAAIRQVTYKGSGMGRSILQVHPDFNTPIRDDYIWPRRWIRKAMESYAWVFDQTLALITARGLRTIVVFNGRFTHDRAAAAAAESLGVKVLYYDYGGIETYFDLTHSTTHDWDSLQARMTTMWSDWGSDRDEIAHAWFANRENRSEPGIEVFIGEQEPDHLPELPTDQTLVTFFSSSGDEIVELDLDWNLYFGSQVNALRTLASMVDDIPGVTLIVRTHPHMRLKPEDDLKRWVAAVKEIGRNIHIGPDSPADSYALMRASDLVITYGSTSGIESAYRHRPTAVMGPSAYQLLGCVTPLTNQEELARWLESPPAIRPEVALPYGLMMQRRGFNLNWLSRNADGTVGRGEKLLSEPSVTARKISHAWRSLRTRWLTSR